MFFLRLRTVFLLRCSRQNKILLTKIIKYCSIPADVFPMTIRLLSISFYLVCLFIYSFIEWLLFFREERSISRGLYCFFFHVPLFYFEMGLIYIFYFWSFRTAIRDISLANCKPSESSRNSMKGSKENLKKKGSWYRKLVTHSAFCGHKTKKKNSWTVRGQLFGASFLFNARPVIELRTTI